MTTATVLVYPPWRSALSGHYDVIVLDGIPVSDQDREWVATSVRTRLNPGGQVIVGRVLPA